MFSLYVYIYIYTFVYNMYVLFVYLSTIYIYYGIQCI
jgi:hypothetical protein